MSKLHITRRGALLAGVGVTAAGCATAGGGSAPARFEHGVASGDPLSDRVVIWTRATPAQPVDRVPLRWVVAEDDALSAVVAEGEVAAAAARDYTAKVDVAGLEPGRTYHYGFFAGETASPVGKTKTLPVESIETLRIAVFSCSNYPFGRFHAYADMATRPSVDVAVHLGDYIYEYGGEYGWGWEEGMATGRTHEPQHEIVTLADYRTRYAQYRSDPDLQAAHAAAPWILVWDDHEICNNPWVNGAQNHNEDRGEGTWEDRKAAALMAYYEWMPIREPEPGRVREAIWRKIDFGGLASLVMLETRLTGRSRQLYYPTDLKWLETAWKADDRGVMQVVPEDQLIPTPPPGVEMLRTPFGPDGAPLLDYARAKAMNEDEPEPGFEFRRDIERFRRELLEDPDRTMIGAEQEAWLVQSVADAEAKGAWAVIGGQIVFARQTWFDYARYYDAETIEELATDSYLASQMEIGQLGLPGNLDAWDGYPVQRDRISDALSAARAHVVMLAGDTHAFWANEVADTSGARCAAEFGTTGVTSPGYGPDYVGVSPPIAEVIAEAIPEMRYTNGDLQGYLLLTLTREEAVCDLIATARPADPEPNARVLKRFVQRRRGTDGVLPALQERDA
jgi:alkaline phosphatase D